MEFEVPNIIHWHGPTGFVMRGNICVLVEEKKIKNKGSWQRNDVLKKII